MNFKSLVTICATCFALVACSSNSGSFKYQAVDMPLVDSQTEKIVDELYSKMSPEERIAQLTSMYVSDLLDENRQLDPKKCEEKLSNGIGHFAQFCSSGEPDMTPNQIRDLVAQVQDWLINNTPNGIPALFHEEVLSGIAAPSATIYPQQIGLAGSFNIELAEQKTRETAADLRKIGGMMALSPMVDVSRNPSFNRDEESYGEDSYLCAALGTAFVRGLQYGGLENGIAACTKHFLGYGSGYLSEDKELYEEILLPHEAAIRTAGSKIVMTGYHNFRGTNCVANPDLANGMLRTYLKYDGVMVSDYGSVNQIVLPEGENSSAQRAAAAVKAGNDVEFQNPTHYPKLLEAIEKGYITEAEVETAVKRVLSLKARLGLLDENPTLYAEGDIEFDTPQERETAYKLASQSIVLLKNDGILPLKGDNKKIALTGPNANQFWAFTGDYTYPGMAYFFYRKTIDPKQQKVVILKDAMENKLPQGWELSYERGCDWTEVEETNIPNTGDVRAYRMWLQRSRRVDSGETADYDAALAMAAESDVIIAAVGENVLLCGENRDRGSLRLPGKQEQFVEDLIATGKPVVLLMFGGRAQVIDDLADRCAAVIQAWYPGEEGANAVADILYGKISPSSKLSVSYPNVELNENICYNYSVEQDPRIQYPFGYGLSYTTFEYSNLQIDTEVSTGAKAINLNFDLENTGSMEADEIVEIYLSPSSESQNLKPIQLQGFGRISLKPGEKKTVSFLMSPQQFGYYNNGHWTIDAGDYIVKVAASSQDIRLSETVTLKGKSKDLALRDVYFAELQ